MRTPSLSFGTERTILEHEMTKHIVQLPNPDSSLHLRELDHRIKNELTSAIYVVSAKAVQSDSATVKAALLDVVDFLHQWADVHLAQHMPDQGRLADAAKYLEHLCFSVTRHRLHRLAIRVLFSADDLRLRRTLLESWADYIRANDQCGTPCTIRGRQTSRIASGVEARR